MEKTNSKDKKTMGRQGDVKMNRHSGFQNAEQKKPIQR
jgi:hypothetical protein